MLPFKHQDLKTGKNAAWSTSPNSAIFRSNLGSWRSADFISSRQSVQLEPIKSMSQYLSLTDSQPSNIAALLDKLASQPNGLDNGLKLAMLLTPKPDAQPTPDAANRNRLIAIALQVVRNEGIKNPPYFKGMTDEAIREFIALYSPEFVLN